MSFIIPKINPDSYTWLEQQDPHSIAYEHLLACADDYIRHNIEQNVDPSQFQPANTFLHAGDLQELANVVSWWPLHEGAPRPPTMAILLTSIRTPPGATPHTFRQALGKMQEQCKAWLSKHNHDPSNPNETVKERDNRLAAARMRKYRQNIADNNVEDPDEMALVRAVRAARENLKVGKKWLKRQEEASKLAYDYAVNAARVARIDSDAASGQHLTNAENMVRDAEYALESYRINK